MNCIVADRFEEALKEAQKVDDLIASKVIPAEKLAEEKPFLGVPFTTKDCIPIKGKLNFFGIKCTFGNIYTKLYQKILQYLVYIFQLFLLYEQKTITSRNMRFTTRKEARL